MKKITLEFAALQNPDDLDSGRMRVQSWRNPSHWTGTTTQCRMPTTITGYPSPVPNSPALMERISANRCGERQNPGALDSEFWLGNQIDTNQGLGADSRIQKILARILRILE